jgi:CubicO group peptidase (beta-lactamase class C family)
MNTCTGGKPVIVVPHAKPTSNNMLRLVIFIFLIVSGFISKAQQFDFANDDLAKRLDNYLVSANNAYKLNGSVLIARKGQILVHKAYGLANVASRILNDTLTHFPILSVSKSFTATMILKLQEEGKLSLKDKLSKYFPSYQYGDKVTIENLLTHTSGITNYTDAVGEEDSAIVNHPISKEKILETFFTKPLEFKPGSRFSYNNSGYFLLGLIIEKVKDQPYEQVIKEDIFGPLLMTNSGFDFNNLPENIRAQGYNVFNANEHRSCKHYDSTYAYAAGAIYSTTGDLYKFAQAVASKKILTSNTWQIAFQARINHYGYGWNIGNLFGRDFVRHDGGYPGFMSSFIYFPQEDITIIILNNFGTYGENVWATAMGIASILFNLPYDLWKLRVEQRIDEDILKQYVGLYKLNKKTGLSITYNNGQLQVKGVGNSQAPELPLLCEGDNKFFLRDFNTTFTFRKDGNSFRLVIHEHGVDTEWNEQK